MKIKKKFLELTKYKKKFKDLLSIKIINLSKILIYNILSKLIVCIENLIKKNLLIFFYSLLRL